MMQMPFFTIPLLGSDKAAEELNRFLGTYRILAVDVRAAYRNQNPSDSRNDNLGFRCARAHDRTGGSGPEQTAVPSVPRDR